MTTADLLTAATILTAEWFVRKFAQSAATQAHESAQTRKDG